MDKHPDNCARPRSPPFIPLSLLQPLIFVVGLVQGFVALFWLRRLGYMRLAG